MARTRFTVKEGISVADDNSVGGYPLVPIGSVMPYAGSTSPEGWLLCDGRSTGILRTNYANLFAVIGTTYGSGDGSTTFNLPDMRSRMPIGAGAGTGLTTRALSATGGTESIVIASGNLPTHTHGLNNHIHTLGGHTHTTTIDPPNTGSGTVSADHGHSTNFAGGHEHRLYFVTDAGSGTTRARVSASGTSLSNTGISEYTGAHDHGTTNGINTNHTHNTDIGAFNATSGGPSTDSGASSGNTTDGGFTNTALATMNPFLALNYIIKY